MTTVTRNNFLSDQELQAFNELWNGAGNDAITMNGAIDRRFVPLRGKTIKSIIDPATLSDWFGTDVYQITRGFMSDAPEPFQIHTDNNPVNVSGYHVNTCVSLGEQQDQGIVLFTDHCDQKVIAVDNDTSEDKLEIYRTMGYTPITSENMGKFMVPSPWMDHSDTVKSMLAHCSHEMYPYFRPDEVIFHRYNKAIRFPNTQLHAGMNAIGPFQRLVFIAKID